MKINGRSGAKSGDHTHWASTIHIFAVQGHLSAVQHPLTQPRREISRLTMPNSGETCRGSCDVSCKKASGTGRLLRPRACSWCEYGRPATSQNRTHLRRVSTRFRSAKLSRLRTTSGDLPEVALRSRTIVLHANYDGGVRWTRRWRRATSHRRTRSACAGWCRRTARRHPPRRHWVERRWRFGLS
jgi:hypothetical protein